MNTAVATAPVETPEQREWRECIRRVVRGWSADFRAAFRAGVLAVMPPEPAWVLRATLAETNLAIARQQEQEG